MAYTIHIREMARRKIAAMAEDMSRWEAKERIDDEEAGLIRKAVRGFAHTATAEPFNMGGVDGSGDYPSFSYADSFVYVASASGTVYRTDALHGLTEVKGARRTQSRIRLAAGEHRRGESSMAASLEALVGRPRWRGDSTIRLSGVEEPDDSSRTHGRGTSRRSDSSACLRHFKHRNPASFDCRVGHRAPADYWRARLPLRPDGYHFFAAAGAHPRTKPFLRACEAALLRGGAGARHRVFRAEQVARTAGDGFDRGLCRGRAGSGCGQGRRALVHATACAGRG